MSSGSRKKNSSFRSNHRAHFTTYYCEKDDYSAKNEEILLDLPVELPEALLFLFERIATRADLDGDPHNPIATFQNLLSQHEIRKTNELPPRVLIQLNKPEKGTWVMRLKVHLNFPA